MTARPTGLTAADKELRAGRLTGTTLAAALGLHSYASPLYAYRQALGIGETKVNDAMEWGLRLEPAVAQKFADRRGITIERLGTRQHPEFEFLAASGDYRISAREGLEIKTAGRINKVDMWGRDDLDPDEFDNPWYDETLAWGSEGSEDIPYEYIVQCAVQMAVFDLDAVWVAVLIGGRDYREYIRERDLEFEQMLIDGARKFYRDHIIPQIPPPPRNVGEWLAFLKDRFPVDNGKEIPATSEIKAAIDRLREYKSVAKEAKRLQDEDAALIKEFMGDAAAITINGEPALTWKSNRPSYPVNYEALALSLEPSADAVKKFTTTKQGNRPLLVKK